MYINFTKISLFIKYVLSKHLLLTFDIFFESYHEAIQNN
jgi:hypothetical protein